MSSLTVELVQSKLLEAKQKKDEMDRISYEKQKLSKHRKHQEYKNLKDPSTQLTSITQIKTPGEEKVKDDKGNPTIPQADFAHTYTDKMPHGQGPASGKGGTNQKSPANKASVTSMNPNQTTKLSQVKNPVKGTEDAGKQQATVVAGESPFAHEITDKMPHGSKNLGTGNKEGGEGLSKPSVAKMAGGPTRSGGQRQARSLGEVPGGDRKHTAQVDHSGGDLPQPSDAMKWRKGDYKTNKQGHNVVETGVALKLRGKTKAVFEVVSQEVLQKMIDGYAKHGYTLIAERIQPQWKQDHTLLTLLRETMHAKHNFVPKVHNALRKAALSRFSSLVSESHSELYEDRQDFLKTVISAFRRVEEIAEKKYVKGLEIFECTARVNLDEDTIADVEIVTEATDHCMALRQIANQLKEEFGLDADIDHIFVDGDKYKGDDLVCEFELDPVAVAELKKKN